MRPILLLKEVAMNELKKAMIELPRMHYENIELKRIAELTEEVEDRGEAIAVFREEIESKDKIISHYKEISRLKSKIMKEEAEAYKSDIRNWKTISGLFFISALIYAICYYRIKP